MMVTTSTKAVSWMLRREDYKAIKRMDKPHMTEYLEKIYRRGYEAGLKAAKAPSSPSATQKPDSPEENVQEGE